MDLRGEIEQISHDYLEAFEDLNTHDFNWSKSEKEWSIAQNIAHVMRINKSFFPIWDQMLAGTYNPPFMTRFTRYARVIGDFIHASVLPDRRKRSKTMKIWEPDAGPFEISLLKDFLQHQKQLKNYMIDLNDQAEHGAVIHSPASKFMVYPLGKSFEIILTHEKRHLEQAKGVLIQM